jgi:hypothetical protein
MESSRPIAHPLDQPLQSSPNDFQIFIEKSTIWADIKMTMEDRVSILMEELVREDDPKEFFKIQHEIKVWRELIILPHHLMEHAKIEQKLKEQNNA